MNANKNGRLKHAHEIPAFTVAPVTRAVRAALAISLTLFALGSSSAAFAAATCVPSAKTPCDGAFIGISARVDHAPIDDPALVGGQRVPSSVTPAAGLMSIDARWGVNTGATHADITTVGDELFAQHPKAPSVSSTRGVTTHTSTSSLQSAGIATSGDVNYINNGPISAYGTGTYDVTAVYSSSATGSDTVDNQSAGTINAVAQDGNAIAVNASGYVDGTVTNEGAITSSSVNGIAAAVIAQAYTGNTSVTNSGSITATSTNYQAVGVLASSAEGSASVTNSASITAIGGQDQAVGIEAFGQTGSSIYNTGSVTATSASGTAIGILAQTSTENASITNTSSITVTSGYSAVGLSAVSANGDASAASSGFMQVIGHGGLTSVIEAYSAAGNATASNSGLVVSGSYGGSAVGVSATSGDGEATASNAASGYLRVVTPGTAASYATGIAARTYNGDASASNAGTIFDYSKLGVAIGINVSAAGGDASAINTGTIQAQNNLFANVRGIQAISSTGQANATNSGTITASSIQVLGYPFTITSVLGIGAQSYTGTTVTNSGSVSASGPWKAYGVEAISIYGSAEVTNSASGSIFASGLGAHGIAADVDYGFANQAVVNNAGSIRVSQVNNCDCNPGFNPYGFGIAATSYLAGGTVVNNTGSIIVAGQQSVFGIRAVAYTNETTVNNSGTISVGSNGFGAENIGIAAFSAFGDVDVLNSGKISVAPGVVVGASPYTHNQAIGINGGTGWESFLQARTPGYYGAGNTSITNSGDITINNSTDGFGIRAVAWYGSALVSNSGHITLDDPGTSWGVYVRDWSFTGTADGNVVDNSGNITATGLIDARGIEAIGGAQQSRSSATITNSGDIAANAVSAEAYGVFVRDYSYTDTSDLKITNSGTISASNIAGSTYINGTFRGAQADGIRVFSYANDAIINNSGLIAASMSESVAAAAGSAIGVLVHNGYGSHYGPTSISNSGSITASALSNNATSSFHSYYARGAFAGGVVVSDTYGDVAVANTGSITATATGAYNTGAGLTTADGISVASKVGNSSTNSFQLGDITLTNGLRGSIASSAESTEGTGAAVANGIAAVVSFGSQGGSLVSLGDGITVNNAGLISATALVDPTASGAANAIGVSAINGSPAGSAKVSNLGTIFASATSPTGAAATGVFVSANDITVALKRNGLVAATATGSNSVATGLSASGATVSVSNAGSLRSIDDFVGGTAYGAQLTATGVLSVTNIGQIHARANNAVGVSLSGAAGSSLFNDGQIIAVSTTGNGIAIQGDDFGNTISNSGSIIGTLQSGAGNDVFVNTLGGAWSAAGTSNFGAGDDSLSNAGTIQLIGSAINLGDAGAHGNTFTNTGVISVTGSNRIDMGAANANAFTNNGTLNFQNGVAGDTLAIAGNFGGSGSINLDVSGLHGTSDQLQIAGNVLAGSVSRVNLNVLDDPTTASTVIPLITVGGNSVAGSFVLGTVVQNKSFIDVLVSKIDPANTNSDAFSLGLSVPKSPVSAVGKSTADTTTAPPVTPPTTAQGSTLFVGTPVVTPVTGQPSTSTGTSVTAQATVNVAAAQPTMGFEESVAGLSNLGTLAVSAAPGAQSLMNSQIGTLEDRMGATSQTLKGGLSAWLRVFGDSGKVDPTHSANNFGQAGNFAFDQNNEGQELGLDFALTDELKAGLLLAKGEANQHLVDGNNGSSRITATTSGIYGTWVASTGFYVDASYRSMTFNSRLKTAAGQAWLNGKANAFNVEAGQTFTLGDGLQIAPQFQYTWDRVDDVKSETASLAGFDSRGDDSSRARLGLMVSKSYNAADQNTVWTPYASLSAVHEFDGKNRYSIDNTFNGQTSIQSTSALIEGGINVKIHNVALYGGVNWLDGGAQKSFSGGRRALHPW